MLLHGKSSTIWACAICLRVSQTFYEAKFENTNQQRYVYDEIGFCIRKEIEDTLTIAVEYEAPTESITRSGTIVSYFDGSKVGESVTGVRGQGLYVTTAKGGICSNPLYNSAEREAIKQTGVLTDADGAYHHYTFDDLGNPVHIESYSADGTFVGTCDLVWEKLNPIADVE